ncbi:efflux RND transporter permease subunit [Pontivivens ytuae]|uniref:Efflux RND transporter permease subunit n=1 Tax=Pontivivens ytuae TaxID=2789856 RepID=A0A7S9LR25_9RHOB|nr:efflux RND transporter permease subunit [Pontivivens ytuae]QPH53683.1 efflux RND transporter permease subunit [Pontivivens ytuae]
MISIEAFARNALVTGILSVLLFASGVLAYLALPVREYPDTETPIVTVQTDYRGAAAAVVETRVTREIEERLGGLTGLRTMESTSQDGRSSIRLEFDLDRDVDVAASDVRDRVGRAMADLPPGIDPPVVTRVDADASPIMWFNLASDRLSPMELTDYARDVIAERLSALPGVGNVIISGGMDRTLRIWLDPDALAGRGLTVTDVEDALRRQNVEVPAGRIDGAERYLAMRIARGFDTTDDMRNMIIHHAADRGTTRLGDVADVEIGPRDTRAEFRGNGEPMVGIGTVRRSGANAVEVAENVRAEVELIRAALPAGLTLATSYDSTFFIGAALQEVGMTLAMAAIMVIAVIWAFLGSWRTTVVPAITVPLSVVATFTVLWAMGYSLNLVTLLALVLAIGLVVDDAIVVIENIQRRLDDGVPPMKAAIEGTRQVAGAVASTTLVLIAVFVPIAFMDGNLGRVFTELAVAVSAAVMFSSVIALTLAPMLSARLLRPAAVPPRPGGRSTRLYAGVVGALAARPIVAVAVVLAAFAGIWRLGTSLPEQFAPPEDRGRFSVAMTAPEGASYAYAQSVMRAVEDRLLPYHESGEAIRVLVRTPARIDGREIYNSGWVTMVLDPWDVRTRSAQDMIAEVRETLSGIPGVRFAVFGPRPFNIREGAPVQVVLGGATYADLAQAQEAVMRRARDNPGLTSIRTDYEETKPQIDLFIDTERAAALGISVLDIGRALETAMGGREVTTFPFNGEELDVIVQLSGDERRQPADLDRLALRAAETGAVVPLSSLVHLEETVTAPQLPRTDRMRTVTITADLVGDYTLAEALAFIEQAIAEEAPETVTRVSYKGESREFVEAGAAVYVTLGAALGLVYLVLVVQFGSLIRPASILLGVPLAMGGGLLGLHLTAGSLNVYSQIGLLMLVGLAAKNGILVVEFARQLEAEGRSARNAAVEAARLRARPILMTGLSTAAGALPMVLASGAGSEARIEIGTVVLAGVAASTLLTLVIVPALFVQFPGRKTEVRSTDWVESRHHSG